jgi:DNA-binding SARP family transcriptional activator
MFIRLIGGFQVLDASGRDCTPRGAKSRALLAMLCQTPDRRRSRRWLESKLWSDRGAEQASGSLRQALMELRKALGPAAPVVVADRDGVALATVRTDIEADPDAARETLRAGREFLEGIDIVDPAFLDWLRGERARLATDLGISPAVAPMAPLPLMGQMPAAAPPFVVSLGAMPEGPGRFAARELALAIAQLVAEFLHVDLFGVGDQPVPEDLPPTGLMLHVEGVEIQGRHHMMVGLVLRGSGQTVWNQRIALDGPDDVANGQGDIPALVFQAAEAALMQMPRMAEQSPVGPACRVNALIARAVAAMFTYDAARLRDADAWLEEAGGLMPSGRIDAWRSLVRHIMYIERTEGPRDRLIAEADRFARRALEQENGNPLVLALVSQTRVMVDTNPDAGTVLARDAVRLSPFNAFGYWSAAGAEFFHKRYDEGLATARHGCDIASRTAIGHWWEALAAVAALNGGHHSAAIAHAEAAFYRAPNFRAVMRHLAYLYLETGQPDKARRVFRALIRAEPDFHEASLLSEDYPSHSLRKTGMAQRHQAVVRSILQGIRGGSGRG